MTTHRTPLFAHAADSLAGPLQRLAEESAVLIRALAQPGPLLRDVDHLGALLAQAHAVEGRDPARAAELRRRASRMLMH